MVHIQNVERQNVELQNVGDNKTSTTTKRRHKNNVDILKSIFNVLFCFDVNS
jgi:hypothetical protein